MKFSLAETAQYHQLPSHLHFLLFSRCVRSSLNILNSVISHFRVLPGTALLDSTLNNVFDNCMLVDKFNSLFVVMNISGGMGIDVV